MAARRDDSQLSLWPGDAYDILARGGEPRYRLYPSLLDKYQQLLDYEEEADAPWNKWTEKQVAEAKKTQSSMCLPMPYYREPEVGDYILTPDEYYDKLEQELVDAINREPSEPSEAADKGTALNEVVDCLLKNEPCRRGDMTIQSIKHPDGGVVCIRVGYDGFVFDFDPDLCRSLRDEFKGALCQVYTEAAIDTRYGAVLLYGYMDYWRGDKIIDLKTTGYYEFGKYERKWQRWVYPYCAIESGLTDKVSEFVYHAVKLGKGRLITGAEYPEAYTYDHAECKTRLKGMVESFVGWLESPGVRPRIKDKKIFNG